MLKGIPRTLGPDLLWALAAMGHGDRLAVVDANYPAHSHSTRVIPLAAVPLVDAIGDVLSLFPVDDFVEPAAFRMVPDGRPDDVLDVHRDVERAASMAEGRAVRFAPVERTAFYDLASGCFATVATTDDRPYGCFVITKGVVTG
jgi:L-fucose mutarotase